MLLSPSLLGEFLAARRYQKKGKGKGVLLMEPWDLEPGSNFQSSRYSATQSRLCRMVMGMYGIGVMSQGFPQKIKESDSVTSVFSLDMKIVRALREVMLSALTLPGRNGRELLVKIISPEQSIVPVIIQ